MKVSGPASGYSWSDKEARATAKRTPRLPAGIFTATFGPHMYHTSHPVIPPVVAVLKLKQTASFCGAKGTLYES